MPDLIADQRRSLRALQRVYGSELAARGASVAAAADTLRIGRKDRPGLLTLRHLVHQLAGSAGILGFTALGKAASRVEETAISAIGGGAVTRDLIVQLRRLSEALAGASLGSASVAGRPAVTHRRPAARLPGRRRAL